MTERIFLAVLLLFSSFVLSPCSAKDIQRSAQTSTTGIHTYADSSVLSQGLWVRVSVTETGIYQITDTEMKKMGFSDPSKVGVYGFGGNIINEAFSVAHIDDLPEVPVYRDDTKGRTLFYAQGLVKWNYSTGKHSNNFYANQACYFLHQKDEAPLELTSRESASQYTSATVTTDTFDDYFLYENDLVNIGQTGREMYGESFLYTTSRNFTFSIPGITASDNVALTVDFIAYSSSSTTIKASLNNEAALTGTISAIGSDTYRFANKVTSTASVAGTGTVENKVTLQFVAGSGSVSLANLNYIKLGVKRTIQPYDSYTLFRCVSAVNSDLFYKISSFNSTYQVWDVTTGHKPVRQMVSSYDGNYGFQSPISGLREYVIVNPDATFSSVTSQGVVENQNLHALDQTDMVIIVTPELQSYAEQLAAYRRSNDGLSVHVVNPQQIYNEFSSGTADATAYRLFMKMFYDRGLKDGTAPKYLLLFGDGANDNRAKNSSVWLSYMTKNMLLTYQSEPSLKETESYVCDDYFGFLDDNEGGVTDSYGQYTLSRDKVDIGIGRLPVRNADEAQDVLSKILSYSDNNVRGNWKNQLMFLGDDGDNNTHMKHADSMTVLIKSMGHQEYMFNKIYLDAYQRVSSASGLSYPTAKKAFFDQLQSGCLLFNYSGHGNTTSITAEGIFRQSEAEALNMKRLPVWVTATCDFSRFDNPETTAGESLLLNPKGGAVAMFTTTRVVYSDGNLRINSRLIANIFTKQADGTRYRLGDVMRLSKRALGTDSNKLNFVLLGDPSMTMAYPGYQMEVTEINGVSVTQAPYQMKALSTVTVKGRVLELDGVTTATDFNGLVNPTVFDSEESVTTLGNIDPTITYTYNDRSKKLFTGQDSIRSGEFEFTFIVPKDISYSMLSGMINLYGVASDGREANGYCENFIVGGTEENLEDDTQGPKINFLYLNSDNFANGDLVNSTPYLVAEVEDETAINASGVSIGHDITATLTCGGSSEKYILNSYFVTYTGEVGKGLVSFTVPELEEGDYSLEFKVWDVYNNSSSKTITFKVKSDVKPVILDLQASPNPAKEEVEFSIYHNMPETSVTVKVEVYTQMGQKIWEYEDSGVNSYQTAFSVSWDLKTLQGAKALPGIYLYRVSAASESSSYVSKSKKLIVLGQ